MSKSVLTIHFACDQYCIYSQLRLCDKMPKCPFLFYINIYNCKRMLYITDLQSEYTTSYGYILYVITVFFWLYLSQFLSFSLIYWLYTFVSLSIEDN
jgi:hypothetical protein